MFINTYINTFYLCSRFRCCVYNNNNIHKKSRMGSSVLILPSSTPSTNHHQKYYYYLTLLSTFAFTIYKLFIHSIFCKSKLIHMNWYM